MKTSTRNSESKKISLEKLNFRIFRHGILGLLYNQFTCPESRLLFTRNVVLFLGGGSSK